jgi:hypothetical protein
MEHDTIEEVKCHISPDVLQTWLRAHLSSVCISVYRTTGTEAHSGEGTSLMQI